MGSRSFARALALAFNEWLLMLMLFANSIFSYVITRFADYSHLQSPCLLCSSLDHILGRTKHCNKNHWDMICSIHKSEISSLVYCHAHGKLVDVRGMCQTCLFSFATTKKSNAETYRLLVGKLGEDYYFGPKSDRSKIPNCSKLTDCTCCNQMWMPQPAATQVAEPEMLPKIGLLGKVKTGKQSTPTKSVSFNHLPDVGYTEFKIHSDTEPEAVFSDTEPKQQSSINPLPHVGYTEPKISLVDDVGTGKQSTPKKSVSFNHLPHVGYSELKIHSDTESEDEGFVVKGEDHKFQIVDNKTPSFITLPYDLATDKLLNLDFHLQPLVSRNDQKEVHFQHFYWRTNPSFPELIPLNGVPETSEKVLKEEEIISLDNLFLTSRAMEHSPAVSRGKDVPIRLENISLTPVFVESPVKASVMEDSELICTMERSEAVSKEKEEPIRLQDISLTPDVVKSTAKASLMEETELICFNDVTSTSRVMEHSVVVLKEKEEPVCLQDISLTPGIKENSANFFLMEEPELIGLNDVTSTIRTMEHSAAVSQEKEEPIHFQDLSLTPDFMENPANASLMEESGLICLNDFTSTLEAAETPEDVLKGIELMSLHDISVDEVPELLTTNETYVEMLKERDPTQADVTSLESEDIVVSSTNSMLKNSTENCVSDEKEIKEASLTVSSLSEMAPPNVTSHTEAALESESSSFNSMSVAAETNQYSGELLDLADAYNIVVGNEGNKDSDGREQIEKWMRKETSRVSEDLKTLLTQISASRGIEFLSPRDISPKISVNSSDQETKNLNHDMQLLLQKRMLERNESNLSLEGIAVIEVEGESESDRLKRQVDYDRRLLTGLYKELEEERSASAVATNQAMAMITRLQEEKASFQMEALQNLRMMEEQAEYDMEAIQRLNDLLVEREKLIQDLEAEIEYFHDQTPQKKNKLDVADKVTEIDLPTEGMSRKIQSCLVGFEEERLYIANYLEKIENRVNGEVHANDLAAQESVSEVHERVERLKGDLYFLEQVLNSLGHGNESLQLVKEIASHLQSLDMKRQDHTES